MKHSICIGSVKRNLLLLNYVAFFHLITAGEDAFVTYAADQRDGNSFKTNNKDTSSLTDNGVGDNSKMHSKVFSDAKSYDKLYIEGQKAYNDHLWYSCAHKLENAVKLYKTYKNVVTDCRLQCLNGQKSTKMANFTINIEAFAGFTIFMKTADCIRRCRDDLLGDQKTVTSDTDYLFEERRPYQYLQYCYYKLDKLQKAASAAYTYYLAHPNDTDTQTNMEYYKNTVKVPPSDFLDLEITPYRELYIRGTLAYVEQDWSKVVKHMEECLIEYFQEDERCRANCFDTGRIKGVELMTGVSDMIIQVIMCQMKCEEKLSKLYTDPEPQFLETIFHYMQFAHYQMHDLEKSAEATASFLHLNPRHKVMKENKDVIKDVLKITDEDFVARDSVQEYVKRKQEMENVMDFITKNYRWGHKSEEEGNIGEEILTEDAEIPDDWMTRYEKLGMNIIAKSSDLHREERFITDGLLKQEQCTELLNLMTGVPKQANGAHVFDLKLAKRQMLERLDEYYETSLRMLIRASEMVRHYVTRFNQPDPTYFMKKTSIVCWDPQEDPDELNCYPQEDGTCLKYKDMSEDYYKDLYTTVTYLTTADGDKDFSFLGNDEETDYSINVKCGRTVGFNTGDRHFLRIPKSGNQRCAMIINHTTYSSDDEREYKETIALLHRLDELRLERDMKTNREVMKFFKDKGVEVTKTGKQLKGGERFVADGLASESECTALKDMVMNYGIYGDGYAGRMSPHTAFEKFSGLSVDQVKESDAIFGDGYEHLFKKPSLISPHTRHELYRGITIFRASKMMHSGKVPIHAMKTFLELSENSRLLVERYFNLTTPLYFDFTHLVCRSAVEDSTEDREDLSHPVHADNCLLQPNGSCTKGFPAFTQRDYSAILYLNDDFEGGKFFFAHSNTTEQVSLTPKCGRIVGFHAGQFHGVRAVTSGSRCAMALWFTQDPNYKELAHIQARKAVRQMEQRRPHVHDDL